MHKLRQRINFYKTICKASCYGKIKQSCMTVLLNHAVRSIAVYTLCLGGPLQEILTQDGFLPETTICNFGRDILLGLSYLHERGIVFADLCPKKVKNGKSMSNQLSQKYSEKMNPF